MATDKKSFEQMRDCVKKALSEGCDSGHQFRKMRYAIIVELLQLGYEPSEIKDLLSDWNKKCEKPLGVAEERDQLHGFVDWVVDHNCKVGCKALEDYCIGKETCQFHFKITAKNRQETKDLPFDRQELRSFLDKRFKADGYLINLIVSALRCIQVENSTGEVILIGLRKISSVIRDKYGHYIDIMTILRKIHLLVEEGVLQLVTKGKSGTFNRQANGYRFLPWKPPICADTLPIITEMCNREKTTNQKEDTQ